MTSPSVHTQALARSTQIAMLQHAFDASHLLQTAMDIQQIPAPTFAEQERASFIRRRFLELGLQDVTLDAVSNVYGRWPGTDSDRPAVLIAAHTDTVFPPDTDLSTRQSDERLYGPGIGDNSLGVAALLALLELLARHDIHPLADLWITANSREEGLGNLDGMRAVWGALHDRLGAAVIVEGMALGRIYHTGIAVRRFRISCQVPGGHSWLHYGQPSAIHSLIRLGAKLIAMKLPTQPRTTFNIGLIQGGHSVNSLATSAECYIDLRSESPDSVTDIETQIRSRIEELAAPPDIMFDMDKVGDRPAGAIPGDHPLVHMAIAALKALGYPAVCESGSTDANILLANGLPAVTIGITHGGNAHRTDEFIETRPVTRGFHQFALLVLAAANWAGAW